MLTKNFYSALMCQLSNASVTNGCVDQTGAVCDMRYNSSANTGTLAKIYNLTMSTSTGSSGEGVKIGTGVTPATADDYTMENQISSGVSIVNQSKATVTKENGFVAIYANYTITNTQTTALAISEIGLIGSAQTAVGSSTQGKSVLYDRTTLEVPLVINPGEAKTLTYTIRFNYPTE